MPIYVYECDKCEKRDEDLSPAPEKNKACPNCHTGKLVLQIGTGIHVKFNGVGWQAPLARPFGE
jgi:putative FmdB family regulatory protein